MQFNLNPENLASGSARHPWLIIGGWLVGLALALLLTTTLLGDALTTEQSVTNAPESERASRLLEQRLGESNDTIDEMVIVRSTAYTVDTPTYQSYVEDLFSDITDLDTLVAGGAHYYLTNDESMVSADRHSTFLPLAIPANAAEEIDHLHEILDEANKNDSFEVFITGEATMMQELMEIAEKDLQTGEGIGISVAMVVLTLVFGAIAAALLPIVLALAAVLVALGATAIVGQVFDLVFFVTNMITMMGLAVGIDYSLFIVSRYREERANGLEKIEAITTAGATASRAVLFSGMTVVLALCGLLLFPMNIFQAIGIGAIIVVIASVFASLTLLPAMLGLMGDKVNAIRIPLIQRSTANQQVGNKAGFWNWTSITVMRRPVVSLLLAASVLLVAATPFFDLKQGMSGISSLPDGLRGKDGFLVLQKEFGFGMNAPAIIVVDGQSDSAAVQGAIERLETILASDPAFVPIGSVTHPDVDLSIFTAMLMGDPMGKDAMDAVTRLRTDYVPQAFADVSTEVLVTGSTAEILDFNETTNTYTPIVFSFVLGLSFILLTVAFRSIVVPITSIIMNLLSVGAAYGLLVLVFQKGVGAELLGFQQVDAIESFLPLFLFSILFGLSMDYHVFLLSRIRERFIQIDDNSEAVAFGIRSTGRLITGAALIMVAVFGGFALGDLVMMQQMGFGLAVAVFMDATIVRTILVPSTMQLLGRWNWYLPKWLEWLPQVQIGEATNIATQQIPVETTEPVQPITEVDSVLPPSN